jgi:hypothetical protein
MKQNPLIWFVAVAILLSGCDSTPQKPESSKQQNTPQFETGRFALQKMIPPAHLWAGDAQPVHMESSVSKDNDGRDGKSGYWQATFASRGHQKAEPFSWSGLTGADAPARGVSHGVEDTYNPSNLSMQPFDLNYLKVDSDKAFEVAQQHGGKQLLAKNPKQEVIYRLDWDPRANMLKWHVIYGGSEATARLSIIVNASSGEFVHKE